MATADRGAGKAFKRASLSDEADLSDAELDSVVGGSGVSSSPSKKNAATDSLTSGLELTSQMLSGDSGVSADAALKSIMAKMEQTQEKVGKDHAHGDENPKQALEDEYKHGKHGGESAEQILSDMHGKTGGENPKQAFEDEHKHGKTGGENPKQAFEDEHKHGKTGGENSKHSVQDQLEQMIENAENLLGSKAKNFDAEMQDVVASMRDTDNKMKH